MKFIYILRRICKKHLFYNLKPCRQIGQSFEESLRRGKHVKNLEIIWMNIKTIIEFGFPMMWRMIWVSEDVIHFSLGG